MVKDNVIINKSMEFAIRIVNLYKYLCSDVKEFVMSKQILRSGTSIGANIREGIYAQSRDDFISKMSIALKEASETVYWLELLNRTDYISVKQFDSLNKECIELIKMLTSTVKNSKADK